MNADKSKPLKHGGTLRYARGQAPAAEETKTITKRNTKVKTKDTLEGNENLHKILRGLTRI
jgi:hypothetical protein